MDGLAALGHVRCQEEQIGPDAYLSVVGHTLLGRNAERKAWKGCVFARGARWVRVGVHSRVSGEAGGFANGAGSRLEGK